MTRRLRAVAPRLAPLALAAAFLVAWKLYVSLSHVSPFLLPPPDAVWRALISLIRQPSTLHDAFVTLSEIAAGLGIAMVSGLVVGLVLALRPTVERAVNPFVVAFQVMPKVALIPMFSLWFGFGTGSKVMVAAMFAFLPIVTSTVAGIRAVEPRHRDLFATLRTTRMQRIRLLDLPSALPWILTGMQIAVVLATVGAVVSEFLGGQTGLGYLTVNALNQLQVATMFAAIFLLSVLGYLLFAAVALLRRLLVPWHQSVAGFAHDQPLS